MTGTSEVLHGKRGQIARITLDRPDRRHAVDTETDEPLFRAWTSSSQDVVASSGWSTPVAWASPRS